MRQKPFTWFRLRKLLKSSLSLILLIYVFSLAAGCFQFRTHPKRVARQFDKKDIPVRTDFVFVDNRKVHYVEVSNQDTTKPVVLFIHGSPGSSDNFFNSMKDSALLEGFHMISIDRFGFGYSEFGKAEPSLIEQAKIIEPFLKLFPNRKVYLVGHSYGGPVVVRAAIDYPNDIEGIVVVSGSVSPDLEPESWWRKTADFSLFRLFLPRSFNASNGEILNLKEELDTMSSLWGSITCHVYLLHGDKDKLVPFENAQYAKQKLVHAASVHMEIVPGINHFIPFLYEDLIKNALNSF
jgi:pimeloyl-ACP methyl ester carboxylesterase